MAQAPKVLAELGLPTLLLREVAAYRTRRDWGHLRGLLVRANQIVLGTSLVLMLSAGAGSWFLAERLGNPDAVTTFWRCCCCCRSPA